MSVVSDIEAKKKGSLPARKEQVLRAVVIEYVRLAEPISSEAIAENYEFGVRSATIRNEMAEISDMGYLEQPHTSAGRKPSDMGYRYFVDHLVIKTSLNEADKKQVQATVTRDEAMNMILAETTKALSRMVKQATLAATVKNPNLGVRHAMLSAMGPDRALLVLVLDTGFIENRIVDLPKGSTLEELGQVNAFLAENVVGAKLSALRSMKSGTEYSPTITQILARLTKSIRAVAKEFTKGKLFLAGEEYLLAKPEFHRDQESLARILEGLEDEDLLLSVLTSPSKEKAVTIGAEHGHESLNFVSVIRQPFFAEGEQAGTIAFFGPTRMDYSSSMTVLDYAAMALSQSLDNMLRPSDAPRRLK